MWLNKAETWALADQYDALQLVRENTLTCYNGGVIGDAAVIAHRAICAKLA